MELIIKINKLFIKVHMQKKETSKFFTHQNVSFKHLDFESILKE